MDMSRQIGDAPIEPNLHQMMNALARGINDILNGDAKPENRKNGFVLLVFPFEGHEGRCNYISNAKRDDIVTLMKEQIKRFEGQPEITGRG
jgi:hypothetical protein